MSSSSKPSKHTGAYIGDYAVLKAIGFGVFTIAQLASVINPSSYGEGNTLAICDDTVDTSAAAGIAPASVRVFLVVRLQNGAAPPASPPERLVWVEITQGPAATAWNNSGVAPNVPYHTAG